MTNNDQTTEPNLAKRRGLVIFGFAFAIVLSLFTLGFTLAAMKHESMGVYDISMITVLLAVIGIVAFASLKAWPKTRPEPIAQSARKSRNIYPASMAIGGVLGAFVMMTGGPELNTLFSNDPISSTAAIGAILVWLIATPIITVMWWKAADEHDKASYSDGALIAFHAYVFVVPSWWMAARAGWLPQQDSMIIWIIAMIIWSVVWLYRKYA